MDAQTQPTGAVATECPAELLLNQIANGDPAAEQQLVSHYWRGLNFVLMRQTNDWELAADIAQETFIVVISKARQQQIAHPQALSAFIRQTAINLLIAQIRKDNRRKTECHEDIEHAFAQVQSGYAEQLQQSQLTELVHQIINELGSERDQQILNQLFVYGKDKRQICDSLDLTPTHFDRVLYRARERLKQALAIKLDIDLSEQGLSQLLTVGLVGLLMLSYLHGSGVHKSGKNIDIAARGSAECRHFPTYQATEQPKPLACSEEKHLP